MQRGALAAAASLLAACGAGAAADRLTASPSHYLLTIDQLVSPDFSAIEPEHAVDLVTLTAGQPALERELRSDGFVDAARVGYFRQLDLATSNGPLEVIATVEAFEDSAGAQRSYSSDVQRRDSVPGESPLSTGALGDAAHADSEVSTAPGAIPVVQITVEWRVANLVDVLVVRGRYGGTRLDDALILAHRMTGNE